MAGGDPLWQTRRARGRRKDRPAGKSRVAVCVDEWLHRWLRDEALAKKRTLSQQCEMVLARYAERRIPQERRR